MARDRRGSLVLALGFASGLAGLTAVDPVLFRKLADRGALLVREANASEGAYSPAELRSVENPEESKVRELREQEITQLKIALGRRLPTNRQAELFLRLAELHLEAYRADYLLEGKVFDKRLAAGSKARAIDHSSSRPHLSQAIKACQQILQFRIPFEKMDEVYYFLGYNYGELGDPKQSQRYYSALVQNYPSSRYAAEAYREMGDARFAAADYRAAVSYYESAALSSSAEAQPRVLHKLAWSYYRVKQFDRAVNTMKRAVDATQKSGEKFLSLREEALRDMAVFMTETGKVDEAIAYFQGVASDKTFYPKVLEKLGRQYERNVEPVKATLVYESLLKTHPDSDAGFRVLVKLVDLDLRRGHYKEALARLQGASIPSVGTGTPTDDTQVAAQNLRAMIRRTATEHHEKFRKKNDRAALEVAEAYYSSYLQHFLAKDDPRDEKPEIQMYLAEVKRDLGKSKEASELYRGVVDSRDKRYAKEAGALWTASLSEAIRKAEKGGSVLKSTEPSELEKEFISAADSLQDALGDTPEGRESALKAAEVLAGYKSTQKDAIKRAKKLIARSPKSPQAVTAARLWVQIITDRLPSVGSAQGSSTAAMTSEQVDALDDLQEAMKEIRENAALLATDQASGKGKLKAQLAEQDTRLKIVAIAASERDRDFASAAKGYEAFARDAGQRELAEKAYANAIGAYLKASDDLSVDRVSNLWLKRFEKSPKALESVRGSATYFLIQGRFEASARLFESLGNTGDADALETAARVVEGVGDQARYLQLATAYLSRFKGNPHGFAVLLRVARAHDAAGRDSEAAKAYKECMAGPPEFEAECGARLGDLHLRAKNVAEAKNAYRKVAALGAGKHAVLSPFVGYARFRLASFAEEEGRFDPLRLPEAQLKTAMNQRVAHLEALSRAYISAADAGGPWAVAALDRLAAWALRFADEIDRIAPPQQLDAANLAKFRQNLGNVSGPIRKKAIETWTESFSRAAAAEALSPALPEVADRLADLRVAGYGRAQGPRPKLLLAGVPADGGGEGRSAAMEKTRQRLAKNAQDASAWIDYGNLLWGQGKPLLAKIAYDRAIGLNSRSAAALNNRAVVVLSVAGELEDWFSAAEGAELFRRALKQDEFFVPAKANLASLLNYYRVFAKAKVLWEQVLVKSPSDDAHDGLGVALQGTGAAAAAERSFSKAAELGASSSRFANVYHEAARLSVAGGPDGARRCLSRVSDLDADGMSRFEKEAAERLRKTCTVWNQGAKE